MKTLEFKDNMPKLHNQKFAELVMVVGFDPIANLYAGNGRYKKFLEYDLKMSDGTEFNDGSVPAQPLMVLFFVGEKGIMFSTLRKSNEENIEKYANSFGETFKIEIEA